MIEPSITSAAAVPLTSFGAPVESKYEKTLKLSIHRHGIYVILVAIVLRLYFIIWSDFPWLGYESLHNSLSRAEKNQRLYYCMKFLELVSILLVITNLRIY